MKKYNCSNVDVGDIVYYFNRHGDIENGEVVDKNTDFVSIHQVPPKIHPVALFYADIETRIVGMRAMSDTVTTLVRL